MQLDQHGGTEFLLGYLYECYMERIHGLEAARILRMFPVLREGSARATSRRVAPDKYKETWRQLTRETVLLPSSHLLKNFSGRIVSMSEGLPSISQYQFPSCCVILSLLIFSIELRYCDSTT